MKRIFSFLLLLIFYSAHAQTGGKMAYYYHGKKLSFPVNNARVVIRLKAGESLAGRRNQLSALLNVHDTAIQSMAGAKMITAKLPAGFTAARLKGLSTTLNKQAYIDFVHPCFTSAYGKDMAYGEDVVVKLKGNTTMANLSIRKLDSEAYEQLRIRAAQHAVSMEEEARQIIYQAVSTPESISQVFQEHFGTKNGINMLETIDSCTPHEPMDFNE